MIGIIVAGHGNFASGNLSSARLILGVQEKVIDVDFLEEDSTDTLKEKLINAIEQLGEEVVILTDLAGGSPYNNAVVLKKELTNCKIEVIAGTNLAMIITAMLDREGCMVEDMAENVVQAGMDGISVFHFSNSIQEVVDEDGI
ncbi:PTS system N-acetylgalactosamine-specific IIA component [Mobilisporobacter senegalensis]|uniref:PTS system N-acetylgalactosamine-specific IIA component n=1 Tax=Mobilisporobacter senegalensis TaxID=1329262 RepID=A0A3N1X4P3_9FIRM|nr:PTS galactosamine/N-acetylgalactosamine transporter subunit IIA [Mobilisporobacter senegalensis]ROR21764.1 PTS system N-acetylgalactosamine-specific IIA component [Mobilisporobacter senegalensis]